MIKFPSVDNIALGALASQSSTTDFGGKNHMFVASKAIDGNVLGVYPSPWSCSLTDTQDTTPWWMIDLARPYNIWNVTITVRQGINIMCDLTIHIEEHCDTLSQSYQIIIYLKFYCLQ